MNRSELIETIKAVKPGLASKEIIEQSASIIFTGDQIVSNNDEVSVSVKFESDIEGAVKAETLLKYLESIKDDEINLKTDGKQLLIKAKKTKAGIPIESIKLDLPDTSKLKWKKLPDDFLEVVKGCLFCVSNDATRPDLSSLYITKNGCFATDNFRMIDRQFVSTLGGGFLLPGHAAKTLINYTPTKWSQDNAWLHFKGDAVFSCRKVDVVYPAVDGAMNIKGKKFKFPVELKELLSRAGVFAYNKVDIDRRANIQVADGKLVCRAESELGWCEERLKIDYDGRLNFDLHPDFLNEILDKSRTATVGKHAILFKTKKFSCLIALS